MGAGDFNSLGNPGTPLKTNSLPIGDKNTISNIFEPESGF
jgi:hypothetical protein